VVLLSFVLAEQQSPNLKSVEIELTMLFTPQRLLLRKEFYQVAELRLFVQPLEFVEIL
jgi:hypothetical protein